MKNDMIKITCTEGTSFLSCVDRGTKRMTELIDESVKSMPERKLSYKVFKSGEMPFEELPELIQVQVKSVLRAYPRCTVIYEYNEFSVSTGCCIKDHYGFDHYVAGIYWDSDIYTEEERKQNYAEEFGC